MLELAVFMLCTPVSYLHAPDRKADLVDEGYEMQLLIHNRDYASIRPFLISIARALTNND
jgi:hypothetical protein